MLLDKLAGVQVGSETLRTHAERLGTEREGQQRRAMAQVDATQEPPSELPHTPAPGVLVIEADGVMVRYHDRGPDGSPWHEVKLGIVGGWTGARPDAHLEAPSKVAAREKAAPFARRLGTEAGRRGALDIVGWRGHAADGGGHEAILRPVVVLGDGAKWIWDEATGGFLSEGMFPHAAIWKASVIAKMVSKTDGGYFEPDRYATEAPFLADSWPTRW